MEENITQEQIQNSINAAFDSVNLINQMLTSEKTDENKDTVKRNFDHLEIMLSKNWFLTNLTEQQKIDIDSSIEDGKLFIL
jgi:hypothetical protein